MRLTEAFCNREYNARAMIPDAADVFARWTDDAQRVRDRLQGELDLRFGDGECDALDLFSAGPGSSLFVFIHGGYWRAFHKSDFSWIAPPFVERGVSVAVLDYALAPQVTIEHIVRQNLAALGWLWRHGGSLGFDRNRIVVGGHSAGGHLTAMMLAARFPDWSSDLPPDLVKGGVAISGLFDLEPIRRASFLNVDLKLDVTSARRLSPASMTPATDAPLVTAVGGIESSEFKRQTRLIAERWSQAFRADVPMPGRDHLRVCEALADPASPLFEATIALLEGR